MSDVTAQLLDDRQRERLVDRFGSGALDWLAGLPARVAELADAWKLTVEGPAPHGRTSVVLRCRRADGRAAVLKLSPDRALAGSEARILRLWESTGRVPEVWEVDDDSGAILLESIGEGRTVIHEGEAPPMADIGRLIADLHAVELPPAELVELHPLQGRVNFLFRMWERLRADGPAAEHVSAAAMHRGNALARSLAGEDEHVVPLHGDLHPGNVLVGGPGRGLVAADPRACLGDALFDAADWPLWRAESVEEVERRCSLLAGTMELPAERLLTWCSAVAPVMATGLANRGGADTARFRTLMAVAGF